MKTTNRIRNPFKTRTLSFSDLRTFQECHYAYVERLTFGFAPTDTIAGAAGEATHALAAVPADEREATLASQLEQLPEDQREKVEGLIRDYTRAADELSLQAAVRNREAEKLLSWRDPVTGWVLKAKPDQIGFVDSEGQDVLQITELKTARFLRTKHKNQLYFFAMLASLALNFTGPIRLALHLLGSSTPVVFWYSHKATERSLDRVRSVIRQIETVMAETEKSLDSLECTCGKEHRSLSVLSSFNEKPAAEQSVLSARAA